LFSLQSIHAGSATWNLDPTSGDWNNAANWTPNSVPNGPADTATFGVSNTTAISLSADTEVNSIIFGPGASAYQIRAREDQALTLSGAGITNNSGVAEKFVVGGDISFLNEATAGSSTKFTLNGLGTMSFHDTSTAGDGTFFLNGTDRGSPQLFFYDSSTAGNGTFMLSPSVTSVADCKFFGSSSAGDAVFTAAGGVTFSCFVGFFETSTADNATLIAGAGINGGNGALLVFGDDSTGGSVRVRLSGYGGTTGQSEGNLTIQHNPPGVTIGSLEGNGVVALTDFSSPNLIIGSNNESTTFSGTVSGGLGNSSRPSVTKIGSGTLTLANANTYIGNTTVARRNASGYKQNGLGFRRGERSRHWRQSWRHGQDIWACDDWKRHRYQLVSIPRRARFRHCSNRKNADVPERRDLQLRIEQRHCDRGYGYG
jgi:autotransporter-associated beta strand protein